MSDASTMYLGSDDTAIKRLLENMQRIAVVGISLKEERASHGIAKFLIGQDFDVVGVNPALTEALGVPVYPRLADVPGKIDIVDIFRRSDAVPAIVDDAIAMSICPAATFLKRFALVTVTNSTFSFAPLNLADNCLATAFAISISKP